MAILLKKTDCNYKGLQVPVNAFIWLDVRMWEEQELIVTPYVYDTADRVNLIGIAGFPNEIRLLGSYSDKTIADITQEVIDSVTAQLQWEENDLVSTFITE
jgi:hypothetical protein